MTRGRPTTGERVDVRIPVELIASLDREARERGVTRAQVVRDILTAWGQQFEP